MILLSPARIVYLQFTSSLPSSFFLYGALTTICVGYQHRQFMENDKLYIPFRLIRLRNQVQSNSFSPQTYIIIEKKNHQVYDDKHLQPSPRSFFPFWRNVHELCSRKKNLEIDLKERTTSPASTQFSV